MRESCALCIELFLGQVSTVVILNSDVASRLRGNLAAPEKE
jgi:hypothetical protein